MTQEANRQMWAMGFFMQLALVMLAQLVGIFMLKKNLLGELITTASWFGLGQGMLIGGALFLLALINFRYLGWGREWTRRVVLPMLRQFDHRWLLVMGGVAGISEELFFRGALQPLVGIWIASLLFGFVHYYGKRELLPYGVLATGMGLLMGLVYTFSGSIIVVMAAHSTYNLAVIVALSKGAFD